MDWYKVLVPAEEPTLQGAASSWKATPARWR
jgi:hypothetical protein